MKFMKLKNLDNFMILINNNNKIKNHMHKKLKIKYVS